MLTQLMPPKPKEFFIMVLTGHSTILPQQISRSTSGSRSSTLIDGCSLPAFICSTAATVSTAGAAQQVCPSMDLVALSFSLYACEPNTFLIDRISVKSPSGVEVAWALI